MEKIIIHIIEFSGVFTRTFEEDLEILEKFSKKRWIKNIFLYFSLKKIEDVRDNELFEFLNYIDEDDLFYKILQIKKINEIIFINTLIEKKIQLVNQLRELIWQEVSLEPEMFNNKAIQRELLYKNDSHISVKFLKSSIDKLDYDTIVEKVWVPFVLKPINGVQSAWVIKIKKQKIFDKYLKNYKEFHSKIVDKWLWDNDLIIAEEFINWNFYSIDYLVKQDWSIIISKPVKVTLWTDLWIKDFFNFARILSAQVEEEYDFYKVLDFIKRTVKATGIKNTFVHHEFKINKRWQYKTIELNWRIGWRRLSIYKEWYWINLYDFLFESELDISLKNNIVFIRIYSYEYWILKWFNNEIFSKIESCESFLSLSKKEKLIWKEVWLTKYWFWYVALMRLKSSNYKQIKKDLKFIEDNYRDLLILEK